MLMELSVVEQRYRAIMEVVSRRTPVVEVAEHVERRRTPDSCCASAERLITVYSWRTTN
jgi:hypothetical protein